MSTSASTAVRRSLLLVLTLGLALGGGCDGDDGPGARPDAPAVDDPAFAVAGVDAWYVIGNAGTAGRDTMYLSITPPSGTGTIDAWIDDQPGIRLGRDGERFGRPLDLSALPAGEHELRLAADGADVAFASLRFKRSHPYYVVIATDWDFADPSTPALQRQDEMHQLHADLKLTHFIGPYTFTDPDITEPRRMELAAWAAAQAAEFGDEIGLHIHPYCSFVEYAGVDCIIDESTVYAEDLSGYTINLSAYPQADVAAMLDATDELFASYDLPLPRTFRAGGWTSGAATLRALDAHGYVADSSALNWARMEEWQGQGTGVLYDWNMANWTSIGDTSQPYYPNQDDPLLATAPTLAMLEIPDNAIMVDYVDVPEMIEIFEANWDGGVLQTPRTFVAGFHPAAGFSATETGRVNGICDHADLHLASAGDGPVVYATMSEVAAAFAAR